MPKLEIKILTSLQEVKAVAGDLSDLVDRCGANYSHEPGFLIPWVETANKIGQRPSCVTARASGKLVAFLPLCMKRERKALFAKRLAGPRIGSSPAFDLIMDPAFRTATNLDRIAEAITDMKWSFFQLRTILADSTLANDIVPRLDRIGLRIIREQEPAYFTVTEVDNVDAYWASKKSRVRIELKREISRCAEVCEFVSYEDIGETARIFDLIQSVLRRSWKNSGYLRSTFLPLLEAQYRNLANTGQARAHFVLKDDQPIAFLVEFMDRDGTVNAYYNGMDEAWSRLSPGAVITMQSVLHCLESDKPAYKFWGWRRYIKKLAAGSEDVVSVRIARPTFFHALRFNFLLRVEQSRKQTDTADAAGRASQENG